MQLDPIIKADIIRRANRLAGQISGLSKMVRQNRRDTEHPLSVPIELLTPKQTASAP
jgi:hypothetical protein